MRNPKKQKALADVVGSCPNDVILDILSRLPVESLIRFKSVSKHWLSIITNPEFITTHLDRSTKNPSLLFFNAWRSTRMSLLHQYRKPLTLHRVHIPRCLKDNAAFRNKYMTSPFGRSDDIVIDIKGSCGGLICLKLLCRRVVDIGYFLWNPATRQIKDIKLPEQAMDVYFEGFGYSNKINDYKYVRIGHFFSCPSFDTDSDDDDDRDDYDEYSDSDYDDEAYGVHRISRQVDFNVRALVFSWRTNSWKVIEDFILHSIELDRNLSRSPALCIKGELYWMWGTWRDFSNESFILAFDIAKEEFRRIDFPQRSALWVRERERHTRRTSYESTLDCYRQITKFQDSLAFFGLPQNYELQGCFDLWVMNENQGKDNWTKVFSRSKPFSKGISLGQICTWRDKIVTTTSDNDDDDDDYDDDDGDDTIFLFCDPISRKRVYLCMDYSKGYSLYDYVESLALVDGTNDVEEDASLYITCSQKS